MLMYSYLSKLFINETSMLYTWYKLYSVKGNNCKKLLSMIGHRGSELCFPGNELCVRDQILFRNDSRNAGPTGSTVSSPSRK